MSDRQSDKALQEFLSEAQEIVETFSRDLLALDEQRGAGQFDPEIINDAFRAVHSLKGLSGLFGITAMTNLSHTLETLLDSLRLGKVNVTPRILDLLFEAVELYGRLIADTSEGKRPDKGAVTDYLARLEQAAAPSPEQAPAAGIEDYELDAGILSVLTEYEEHRLRENLKQGRKLYQIHASFDLMTIDKELEELKKRLKPIGEVITYLPSSESEDPSRIELDVLVGSDTSAAGIKKAIKGIKVNVTTVRRKRRDAAGKTLEAEPVADAGELEEPAAPGQAAPPPPEPPPRRKPQPVPDAPAPGAPPPTFGDPKDADDAERTQSLKSVSQTVRVDIRKLDTLMNVVGELGIVRAGVAGILEKLREEGHELTGPLYREVRALERKLNELQSGILEVRMVPLGQIFDKLSRVVRKISREADKEIRFQITGADTELDKLIVEELSDPLMHIIRNAVDHGIEDRETRRRVGKPDAANIAVAATQKGNHVVIEISDDGAGFDEERILETALNKGLIDTAQATELSRRELLNLVFLPGFSTRDEATELSGRGVGMDVVKHNIAKLSGIIDIESWRGRGTRITVTLPITLAIIPALIIEVARRTYAIPLNSVLESITITPADVETIEGREVVDLRGQTLALSRLDAIFQLARPEAAPPPAQLYVVVVGLAQHRLGLVVDDLHGQQDIVIKPLGKALANVPGIAGATELGGQQTVLVLDVAALVEETLARAPEVAA